MTQVFVPTTEAQLGQVRGLMRAFLAWHRQRHHEDLHLVDQYFDAAAFEAELASLPGKYAPPRGHLLLALHDGEPAGCVALRELDSQTCEMKRMFVAPHLRGKGIGRALAETLLREARHIGYRSMRLDTSIRQLEAQALYRRVGFTAAEPETGLPEALRNWLVFMELRL